MARTIQESKFQNQNAAEIQHRTAKQEITQITKVHTTDNHNHDLQYEKLSSKNTSIITESSYSPSDTVGERRIFCDATSQAITINLPTAILNTCRFEISKTDNSVNTITIMPYGAETIKGETSIIIQFQNSNCTLVSDGSNWKIM